MSLRRDGLIRALSVRGKRVKHLTQRSMARRGIAIACLLVACTVHGKSQVPDSAAHVRIIELFTRGYTLIATSPSDAIPVFEEILRLDSTNLTAQRQLGSLYANAGRPGDALDRFIAAYRLMPSDTTRLQIAYLLALMGENRRAYRQFRILSESADSSLRAAAEPASVVLSTMACAQQFPWWFRAQASPYFDTRFNDLIFLGALYAGRYIDSSRVVSGYAVLSLSADTRSTGGAFPVIFSDNYILAGLGLRIIPFRGFTTEVQGGLAVNLVDRPDQKTVRGDFRAVASYGIGLFPRIFTPDLVAFTPSPFADVYASFGYYSRYENGLGYMQARAGCRLLTYRHSALDLYARVNIAADTEGDFYNNVLEAGPGLSVVPEYTWGMSLTVEYLRGTYWSANQQGNPYGKTYTSVRIFLLFDRFLCN